MYLFYDTETTGVPKDYKAPMEKLDNWPRIIQLAFCLYDENEQLIKSFCSLIKPDGWEIPKEKFWIDNGYSTEQSMEQGIPIQDALNEFLSTFDTAQKRICHNLSFDSKIVGAELLRTNVKRNMLENSFCTMQASTNYCAIPSTWGYKWPKLEELHTKLFGVNFDGAHDALEDVRATARCYFELKKLNIIK